MAIEEQENGCPFKLVQKAVVSIILSVVIMHVNNARQLQNDRICIADDPIFALPLSPNALLFIEWLIP